MTYHLPVIVSFNCYLPHVITSQTVLTLHFMLVPLAPFEKMVSLKTGTKSYLYFSFSWHREAFLGYLLNELK